MLILFTCGASVRVDYSCLLSLGSSLAIVSQWSVDMNWEKVQQAKIRSVVVVILYDRLLQIYLLYFSMVLCFTIYISILHLQLHGPHSDSSLVSLSATAWMFFFSHFWTGVKKGSELGLRLTTWLLYLFSVLSLFILFVAGLIVFWRFMLWCLKENNVLSIDLNSRKFERQLGRKRSAIW